jgi:1-acyl-sn-glycerol-3-phosphate acyltransferase
MLHPFIRWLARRGIRWFYASAQFVGCDNIPDSGPVLLVASHGNDLTDILMAFLVTKRDVLFVANVSAADFPIVKWTYAGLGVIPVARTRDARAMLTRGEDVAALNERAFERVTAALNEGNIVAIFPEGVVHDLPQLAPLRTGAAKMALTAISNGVRNLTLIPVGFQYESPWQPRSDVVAVVGNAVRVDEWQPMHTERAVSEFTRFIREQLLQVTRNSATWGDAARLSEFAAAGGAVLSDAHNSPTVAAAKVQRTLTASFGAGASFTAASADCTILAFERGAEDLCARVSLLGARAWSASDYATVLHAAGDTTVWCKLPSAVWVAITFPVAAFGAIWHVIPIAASYAFAKASAPTPMERAGRAIVPGLYLIALWYVSIPVVLWLLGASPWFALVLFLVQPRLGDFALQWCDRFRTLRLASRARGAPPADKLALLQSAKTLRQRWRNLLLISIQ